MEMSAQLRADREAGHCSISAYRYTASMRTPSRDRNVRWAVHFAADGPVQVCAFGGVAGAHECLKTMAGDFLVGPIQRAAQLTTDN